MSLSPVSLWRSQRLRNANEFNPPVVFSALVITLARWQHICLRLCTLCRFPAVFSRRISSPCLQSRRESDAAAVSPGNYSQIKRVGGWIIHGALSLLSALLNWNHSVLGGGPVLSGSPYRVLNPSEPPPPPPLPRLREMTSSLRHILSKELSGAVRMLIYFPREAGLPSLWCFNNSFISASRIKTIQMSLIVLVVCLKESELCRSRRQEGDEALRESYRLPGLLHPGNHRRLQDGWQGEMEMMKRPRGNIHLHTLGFTHRPFGCLSWSGVLQTLEFLHLLDQMF